MSNSVIRSHTTVNDTNPTNVTIATHREPPTQSQVAEALGKRTRSRKSWNLGQTVVWTCSFQYFPGKCFT
jgi:hypothetical protein